MLVWLKNLAALPSVSSRTNLRRIVWSCSYAVQHVSCAADSTILAVCWEVCWGVQVVRGEGCHPTKYDVMHQ